MRFLLIGLCIALFVPSFAAAQDSSSLSPAPRCSLEVKSVPDSALLVYADSVYGDTPCILELPAGELKIALKKKGYYLKTATLSMGPGEKREMFFELAAPARLALVTEPAGATIELDGKVAGLSPLMMEKLKPGDHELAVRSPGWRPLTRTISLKSGASDSLTLRLEPVPPPIASDSIVTVAAVETVKPVAAKSPENGKAVEKKKAAVLDKIAIAVFAVFSVIILGVELAQKH